MHAICMHACYYESLKNAFHWWINAYIYTQFYVLICVLVNFCSRSNRQASGLPIDYHVDDEVRWEQEGGCFHHGSHRDREIEALRQPRSPHRRRNHKLWQDPGVRRARRCVEQDSGEWNAWCASPFARARHQPRRGIHR